VWRVVLGCVIVLLCSGAGAAVFALGELRTLRDDLSINPSLNAGSSLAPAAFGAPQTLLLVGNDQRKHTTTAPVLPHSNEMLLVRFDPGKPYISMMSIPRELQVRINCPNGAVTTRLNFSLTCGGIGTLVKTIRQLTTIPVNHVVEIDFNQFKNAVNDIGCVYSTIDRRYYHVNTPGGPQYQEINLQPGYQRLCGTQSLQFVSYRHGDTSLVRDARDQSFLLDVKKEYGPTLVDNIHKFEKIFGRAVQTDSGLHTTGGILNLLGTLISSSSLRVRQVQFQVNLQPIGANNCACDTATRQQISASVHAFLHGGSGLPTKQSVAAVANAVHKRHGAPPLPLVPVGSGALTKAVYAAADVPFPLELPRVQDRGGSATPVQIRDYSIHAPDGSAYPAYVAVFNAAGIGQYYDVDGTTWTTAPVLDSPQQTVQVGGRTYYLYYEGQHLELVAWYEHNSVYWVRNTLTQAIGNGELLAIAEQTAPATSHIGRATNLGAAVLPQRTVEQPKNSLEHTLGSLGGLVALAALPLLAIPLLRRRRDVAKLRLQLAATLNVESHLAANAPALPAAGPPVSRAQRLTTTGLWTNPVYSSARVSGRTRLAAVAGAFALAALGVVGIVVNVGGGQSVKHVPRHVVQTIPSVPVGVLNATSAPGAAGRLAGQLRMRGVKVATVGNLVESLPPGLLILYAPGARGEAQIAARMLRAQKPTIQPINPVAQAAAGSKTQVVVVVA
jgi:LCP family protein required for cell wall assembly